MTLKKILEEIETSINGNEPERAKKYLNTAILNATVIENLIKLEEEELDSNAYTYADEEEQNIERLTVKKLIRKAYTEGAKSILKSLKKYS